MRNGFLTIGLLAFLAACSFEIPDFVGREGTGMSVYNVRADPLPDPVAVPLRSAELERALHGVIVRAEGVAPRQGYHTAYLQPLGGGVPDAAGVLHFELTAIPPEAAGSVGPERTRLLDAAVFVPNRALKTIGGFRVTGGPNTRTLPLR